MSGKGPDNLQSVFKRIRKRSYAVARMQRPILGYSVTAFALRKPRHLAQVWDTWSLTLRAALIQLTSKSPTDILTPK